MTTDRYDQFIQDATAGIASIATDPILVRMLMNYAVKWWYGDTVYTLTKQARQNFGLDFSLEIENWLRALEAKYTSGPVFTEAEAATLQSTCTPPALVLPDGTEVWSLPAPMEEQPAPVRPKKSRRVDAGGIGGNSQRIPRSPSKKRPQNPHAFHRQTNRQQLTNAEHGAGNKRMRHGAPSRHIPSAPVRPHPSSIHQLSNRH